MQIKCWLEGMCHLQQHAHGLCLGRAHVEHIGIFGFKAPGFGLQGRRLG